MLPNRHNPRLFATVENAASQPHDGWDVHPATYASHYLRRSHATLTDRKEGKRGKKGCARRAFLSVRLEKANV